MTEIPYTCPMSRREAIDTYFLEHRAKLIDVASWLDRLDRSRPESDDVDFREAAFRQAIGILTDGETHRAKRILELLSDHTDETAQTAAGMKGAAGAPLPTPSAGGAA